LVDIVTSEDVSNKHAMEFGRFKQFGKPYPMMDIVEVGGFIVWVPPETGRLVARTVFHERVQNELFLWRVPILANVGGRHAGGKRTSGMNVDEGRPAVRELEVGKMMGDLKSNPGFPELFLWQGSLSSPC
jgi:hypothetical protein